MSAKVSFQSYRAQVVGQINKGAVKGVQEVAMDLLRRSVRLAPVDTGDLRGSASATVNDTTVAKGTPEGGVEAVAGVQPPLKGGRVEGVVKFNEEYALVQHEMVEYEHPRGGQAKYLEQPFLEQQANYREHIARAIRETDDE